MTLRYKFIYIVVYTDRTPVKEHVTYVCIQFGLRRLISGVRIGLKFQPLMVEIKGILI